MTSIILWFIITESFLNLKKKCWNYKYSNIAACGTLSVYGTHACILLMLILSVKNGSLVAILKSKLYMVLIYGSG